MKDKIFGFLKSAIGMAIEGVLVGCIIGFFIKKDGKTNWFYVTIGGAVLGVSGFFIGKMINKESEGTKTANSAKK
jgi:hypothetical protein